MAVDYKKAKELAAKIWKDGSYLAPPIPILDVANKYGLNVLEVDFNQHPNVSGIIDVDKKTIFLNAKDNPELKRFTVARELGLWLLHRESLDEDPNLSIYRKKAVDREATDAGNDASIFATYLLVPEHIFKKIHDIYQGSELAYIFAVPHDVISYLQNSLMR